MKGTSILLLVLFASFTAAQRCQTGWSYFQNSCYLFPDVPATWGTAIGICWELKSNLVEIETPEENKFIEEKNINQHNYWTGGNDIEIESEWKWVTSRHVFNFTDWDRMDSNNLQPNDPSYNEDCMLIYHEHHKWHDAHCGDENVFICERSAAPATTTAEPETYAATVSQQMTSTEEPETTTTPVYIIG